MSKAPRTSRSSKRVEDLRAALQGLVPKFRQPRESSPFSGVAQDEPRTALPDGRFQEDQGGDRTKRGAWRRRRGLLRNTDVGSQDFPVVTLLGFYGGLEPSLIVVAGTNVVGLPDTSAITSVTITGFGEIRWGEESFGE
jgi:hypothetical protein